MGYIYFGNEAVQAFNYNWNIDFLGEGCEDARGGLDKLNTTSRAMYIMIIDIRKISHTVMIYSISHTPFGFSMQQYRLMKYDKN